MTKYVIPIIVMLYCLVNTVAGQYTLSGKVIHQNTHLPIEYAVVSIPSNELWATVNAKGEFIIKNVPSGKMVIVAECLGFAKKEFTINVAHDIDNLSFALEENTLALKDVTVAAKKSNDLTSSYIMDRTALDHLQMINVTDATALLPGGKTNTALNLVSGGNRPQEFSINGTNNAIETMGNANFGVAVDVDGVRLSNNALTSIDGTDVRNIATSNVESIEIVTGIPSVEYGDMSNGLVKINTRKGASQYILEMATQPNTKQISLSKGFALGAKSGVLNFNIEHTKSISDLASPYTSYSRNGLSLNYSNTFNKKYNQPIAFNIGVAGNIGGYDSKADPDLFLNTYTKQRDNVLRTNFSLKWLLHKKWITNVELSGAFNYNDQLYTQSSNQSASASTPAIHTMEEGYHIGQTYAENPNAAIILIQPGYWYQLMYTDSKLINYSAKLKANWVHKYGIVRNDVLAGFELSGSGNNGKGTYYADMQYAPTWRPFPYNQLPYNNNYALYVQDKIFVPVHRSNLQVVAGLRSDITSIGGSQYGTINNLSPRVDAQYTFWENAPKTVSNLSVKIGWGKMVKLPSFGVLYPTPSYKDILTFAPGTTSSGQTFYAYYTIPSTQLYNPNLKWQYDIQSEIGVNATISGTTISVTAQQDKTSNPYISQNIYSPFTYKFTDQSALENSAIPVADRVYSVDKNTGIVTVTDKTGAQPAETLAYTQYLTAKSNQQPINGSPVTRRRISWMITFKPIESIKTSFLVDGNYYYYKGVEETLEAQLPNSSVSADGNPYKYIGYYVGGANYSNGDVAKSLNMNVTAITHIPALRLIITARVEGSLYNRSQYLSQYADGSQRGYVIDSRNSYTPSSTQTNIYGGNRFVAVYPEYYVSLDDMNTKIPFMEKFLWAKQNDVALYNDLTKMVVSTFYNYSFNPNTISAYYSANIAVTKEIGKIASITFNAKNFFNNMAKVHYGWNNTSASLFQSSNIPSFYYGLSLRLKL